MHEKSETGVRTLNPDEFAEFPSKEIPNRYEALFAGMVQGVFFQRADGVLSDVNQAALRMFGMSSDEFLGRTLNDLSICIVREDGSLLSTDEYPSMVALRTGNVVRDFIAGFCNRTTAEIVWVNINAIPLFREGDAKPCMVFATVHDITELRQTKNILAFRLHLLQYAETHSLEELLTEALDQIGILTSSPVGFCHFIQDDGKTVSLQAWSSSTLRTNCFSNWKGVRYPIEKTGSWSDCVRLRRAVVHNDTAAFQNSMGLPEGHVPVIRELIVPVCRGSRIVAVIGVGNKSTDYTQTDTGMVSIAADLSWGIVERKISGDSLKTSEELRRAILDSVGSNIAVLDRNGVIVSVNEPWRRFAFQNSITPDEMPPKTQPGSNYLDVCRRSTGECSQEASSAYDGIMAVMEGRQGFFSLEYPCHSPQEQRWFQMMATPLRYHKGGVVISHRNITDYKIAQQALESTRHRLEMVLEGANVGLYDCNLLTGETLTDGRYWSMLGYEAGKTTLSMKEWMDMVHPDDFPSLRDKFEHYSRNVYLSYENEYRMRHKDGRWVWILDRGKTFSQDKTGHSQRAAGTHMDITDRKDAEEALRESEDQFRSLFDSSLDAVMMGTPDGRILAANHAACRMFGCSEDELGLMGRKGTMNISDKRLAAAMKKRARTGRFQGELSCVRKDGTTFPAEVSSTVFRNRHGEKLTNIIIRDISGRKQAEAEVLAKTGLLEEANIALKVLLKQREEDRRELEERVFFNTKNRLLPLVEELKCKRAAPEVKALLSVLESNIREIASGFSLKLTLSVANLTPQELMVANLIKEGKSSKEIADLMGLSEMTIFTYRNHIRVKLDLKNKKTNLRSYLCSLV